MQHNRTRDLRHIRDHIRLLCHCNAGLEAIAAPLCNAVRDLIGAASGALFWLDTDGNPAGFYHDCAPAELKDLFITQFEELFSGLDEPNMVSLTQVVEPSIGRTLTDGYMDSFWRGNVYAYLCVPLGHHHMLDMRIDVQGMGRAVFCFWNGPERPFTQADVAKLAPLQPIVQRAAANQGDAAKWQTMSSGTAHIITDLSASLIHTINPEAESLLMASHLLQQRITMTQPPRVVPGFITQLAAMTAIMPNPVIYVPVTAGRIVARASNTHSVSEGRDERAMIFVSLELEAAVDVMLVEQVMALPLTSFQREIALYAMQGGLRSACETEFGVSAEALKKHVRAIFVATGATKWTDIETVAEKKCRNRWGYGWAELNFAYDRSANRIQKPLYQFTPSSPPHSAY